MIGPQLIELAQVAEQEHMNRALEHQAARRARLEAKARASGSFNRSPRTSRWFRRPGSR